MKKRLFLLIKLLISGTLLYLIALKVDWTQFRSSIFTGDLFYICMACILGGVFNGIKFLKWQMLVNSGEHAYSYWDSAKSYMMGNALGMVTPMRAGDLGRALYFASHDRPKIMVLTIKDRFIDLTIVFIIATAGSFVLISTEFGILVVLLGGICLFLFYSPLRIHMMVRRLVPERFLKKKIGELLNGLGFLNRKTISWTLGLSFVSFLAIVLEFYYLVAAFEDISLHAVYLVAPLITLSTVLPVSIMGFGVREGLSIFLLAKFGITAATALSAAFLFFIINNLSISLIGVLFLLKTDISKPE